MRVLITGFEPFGGETVNPSWEVARALDGERIAGAQVAALQLPCRFGEAGHVLAQALAADAPAAVIATTSASLRIIEPFTTHVAPSSREAPQNTTPALSPRRATVG